MQTETSVGHFSRDKLPRKPSPKGEQKHPSHETFQPQERIATPEEIDEALSMKPAPEAAADFEAVLQRADPFLGLDGQEVIHEMDEHGIETINEGDERAAA